MWQDASQRAAVVREIASFFKEQDYQATQNLFLNLADILQKGDDKRREKVFNRIAPTFRREYCHGDKDLSMLYDFIDAIFRKSIGTAKENFNEIVLALKPMLDEVHNAIDLIGSLTRAFITARAPLHKQDFLGLCVIYLWHVEGVFDEAVRSLYVLYNASLGLRLELTDVWNLPIRRSEREEGLEHRFEKLSSGESRILFMGLEDYHLRNAIAHARLEYDEKKMKMRFRDFKFEKGKFVKTYDRTLSSEEFSRYGELVEGVSTLLVDLLLIIAGYQMAFSEKPL
jgi:hypothetical protein